MKKENIEICGIRIIGKSKQVDTKPTNLMGQNIQKSKPYMKKEYKQIINLREKRNENMKEEKAKPIKKFNRFNIQLSPLEKAQVLKYLAGDISSRELGKNIGYSHQQSINLIGQICRQWFQKGSLFYHEKNK